MRKIQINDVVKFNKNHRYHGCLGIVISKDKVGREHIYEIAIPIPESGGEHTIATGKEIVRIGRIEVE